MQYMEIENRDDFYSFTSSCSSSDLPVRVWDSQGVGVMYEVALEDLQRLEEELLVIGSYYILQGGDRRKKMV